MVLLRQMKLLRRIYQSPVLKGIEVVLVLTTLAYVISTDSIFFPGLIQDYPLFTSGFFIVLQSVVLVSLIVDLWFIAHPMKPLARSVRTIGIWLVILTNLFYAILQIIEPLPEDNLWLFPIGMAAIGFGLLIATKYEAIQDELVYQHS